MEIPRADINLSKASRSTSTEVSSPSIDISMFW
jgi:hypothetical protein